MIYCIIINVYVFMYVYIYIYICLYTSEVYVEVSYQLTNFKFNSIIRYCTNDIYIYKVELTMSELLIDNI